MDLTVKTMIKAKQTFTCNINTDLCYLLTS